MLMYDTFCFKIHANQFSSRLQAKADGQPRSEYEGDLCTVFLFHWKQGDESVILIIFVKSTYFQFWIYGTKRNLKTELKPLPDVTPM